MFLSLNIYLSLNIVFNLVNSVDFDDMPHLQHLILVYTVKFTDKDFRIVAYILLFPVMQCNPDQTTVKTNKPR